MPARLRARSLPWVEVRRSCEKITGPHMTSNTIAIVQSICAFPSSASHQYAFDGLVSVLALLGAKDRQEDDLQVKQQIPVPDVLHIVADAPFHLL